jgi:hypothetical protein
MMIIKDETLRIAGSVMRIDMPYTIIYNRNRDRKKGTVGRTIGRMLLTAKQQAA